MIPLWSQAGGAGNLQPSFAVGFADAGSGAVDTAPQSSGGSSTPTFGRNSEAACRLSTGLWKLDVAVDVARSHYLPDLSYGGYLAEGAAAQLLAAGSIRDLTAADWVKTTMTTAKTSAGIDGVSNSCTRCTASAGNALALQTITAAASTRTFSVFVKRITGVGNFQLTQDGLTFTTVTTTAGFTQVQLTASQLNAVVGFRIVTSGDAFDIDCTQFEEQGFASTPIPADGARLEDVLTFPFSGNVLSETGAAYAELGALWTTDTSAGGATALRFGGAAFGRPLAMISGDAATTIAIYDGSNTVEKTGLTSMATAVRKRASSWGAAGVSLTGDGVAPGTGTFDGAMGSTTIRIGGDSTTASWSGTIQNLKIWQSQLSDTVLQALTA